MNAQERLNTARARRTYREFRQKVPRVDSFTTLPSKSHQTFWSRKPVVPPAVPTVAPVAIAT